MMILRLGAGHICVLSAHHARVEWAGGLAMEWMEWPTPRRKTKRGFLFLIEIERERIPVPGGGFRKD
jgi:hypothetical protein